MAISITPTNAYAWKARGHMVTAAIAWDQMTPAAQARASALLRLKPQYNGWVAGVPTATRDKVAFVVAATWPDRIRGLECDRSHPAPCYRDDGYEPPDAGSDLNIGYADMRLRKYWHFKDLAFSPDGTAVAEPFAHNAESQIAMFDAALANASLGDEAKSYDLAWSFTSWETCTSRFTRYRGSRAKPRTGTAAATASRSACPLARRVA